MKIRGSSTGMAVPSHDRPRPTIDAPSVLWNSPTIGMMDIALLTANANQLRFLITYNTETKTFYISAGLIVLSLIIQVLVGMGLIFKVSVVVL